MIFNYVFFKIELYTIDFDLSGLKFDINNSDTDMDDDLTKKMDNVMKFFLNFSVEKK